MKYDWSLLNGLQIVPAWGDYFGNPAGQDLGLIAASFYFPQLVFGPLSAYISDKFGRRVALFIGAALSVIGVLLQTFAKTRGQFIGGRVILGSGSAVHLTLVPPMIQELAHPVGCHRSISCIEQLIKSASPIRPGCIVPFHVLCRVHHCRICLSWYDRLGQRVGLATAYNPSDHKQPCRCRIHRNWSNAGVAPFSCPRW